MRKASTAILSQAKRIAEGWFSIPSHYVTVLEDVMDRTTGTEAHLWWQDPNQPNEGVAVSLAMPEGRLLEYEKFELDEPSALESSRQSAALSIDQLLQKFSSRAAHMVVDGASGRLLSFIRFDDELEGQSSTREPLCSSYAACRNKAVSFVQHVFPDAHRFLVLVETERENLQPVRLAAHHQNASETPNGNPNEIFQFEAYVDGLPIYMAGWTVAVRRTDGGIVSYMGSETHPSIFLTTPKTPRITREQAIARVAAELDVQLEWYRDPTSGQDDFTLIYRPHVPQGTIRFIDAISGEPIRERNLS